MSDGPTCCVCLELLSSGDIGATVPCGHVFHVECWNGWKVACVRQLNQKCPSCNTHTRSFVTLYLNLSEVCGQQGDDNVSLSSIEEDEEGDFSSVNGDEARTNAAVAATDATDDETNALPGGASNTTQRDVIVIDDEAPPPPPVAPSKARNNKNYKNIAKSLKRQLGQAKQQQARQLDELGALAIELETAKAGLTELRTCRMERASLIVQIREKERQVVQLSSRLQAAKTLEQKLRDAQDQLELKLKKQSITEQVEFNRLTKERKELRNKCDRLEREFLNQRLYNNPNNNHNNEPASQKDKKRALSEMSKYQAILVAQSSGNSEAKRTTSGRNSNHEAQAAQAKATTTALRYAQPRSNKRTAAAMVDSLLQVSSSFRKARPSVVQSNPQLLAKKQRKRLHKQSSLSATKGGGLFGKR